MNILILSETTNFQKLKNTKNHLLNTRKVFSQNKTTQ